MRQSVWLRQIERKKKDGPTSIGLILQRGSYLSKGKTLAALYAIGVGFSNKAVLEGVEVEGTHIRGRCPTPHISR